MKKIVIFASLIAAVSAWALDFGLGARLDLNYNMFWNVNDAIVISQSERRQEGYRGFDKAGGLGGTFGATMELSFNPILSLEPEFLIAYRSRSANITEYEDYYNYPEDSYARMAEASINQWFIDLPVLLRIYPNKVFYLGTGPILSLNLDSEGDVVDRGQTLTYDVSDYTTTFVLGLAFETGIRIALIKHQFLEIHLRCHLGLTSLVSDSITDRHGRIVDGTIYADPKDFNFSMGLTYWFL